MDFGAMGGDILDGVMGVTDALMMDYTVLGMAVAVIVLAALFMSSLEQIISTTVTALLAFVVIQVVYNAYGNEWDFMSELDGLWGSFAHDGFTFFSFLMYFIVFGLAIAIINVVKGMVAG